MLNINTNMQEEKTVSDHDKESASKTNNDGDPKAAETRALVKSKKEKGKSCCSLGRCFAAICCCTVKKKKKIENKAEDDKKSLTSQEVNEFIEEEMKKLSEETINLEN